jgi:hypothetical protein
MIDYYSYCIDLVNKVGVVTDYDHVYFIYKEGDKKGKNIGKKASSDLPDEDKKNYNNTYASFSSVTSLNPIDYFNAFLEWKGSPARYDDTFLYDTLKENFGIHDDIYLGNRSDDLSKYIIDGYLLGYISSDIFVESFDQDRLFIKSLLNPPQNLDYAIDISSGQVLLYLNKRKYIIIGSVYSDLPSSLMPDDPRAIDPLVLDLDGDGLDLISHSEQVKPIMFDYDGDGVRNKTSWLNSDDAFLVKDRNGDGQINDSSELFSDQTLKYDGTGHCADGFEALKQEDTNDDNIVNNQDDNWSSLRLWRDFNQNGKVDEWELSTLEEHGIVGLNVSPNNTTSLDLGNGNSISSITSSKDWEIFWYG